MWAYYAMAVRFSALIVVALTVSACILVPVTYLKPSAPGGQNTNTVCIGTVGPKDRLVLAGPDGVMIGVDSYSLRELSAVMRARANWERYTLGYDKVGTGFNVILRIPAGRTVRFASRSFFLTDQVTHAVHEYQGTSVLDFVDIRFLLRGLVVALHMQKVGGSVKVRQIDLMTTITGVPHKDSNRTPNWSGPVLDHPYYVLVPFEGVTCVDCRLRLPPLVVDSTTYEFPEVSFKLAKKWVVQPLNC